MLRILATLLVLSALSGPEPTATCTGAASCNACKNCRYCAHCKKEGGSCGVCKPGKPA